MKVDKNKLMTSFFVGTISCLPISGFIYGFFACSDCGSGLSGISGRVFIGILHIFLNIITLGAPYDNEGGTSSTNIRHFVILTLILITIISYLISVNKSIKNKA